MMELLGLGEVEVRQVKRVPESVRLKSKEKLQIVVIGVQTVTVVQNRDAEIAEQGAMVAQSV